ncbi:hypothetical protein H0H87_005579 [Tephrocybe sp. NHM501043]|nr:hypothetical protein H0H87_005579 [Tephrocybe sp. NHM501043]
MPKAVPFVPKPAIEKLPLAVRKDRRRPFVHRLQTKFANVLITVRDKYESELEDFESTISEILGLPFHLKINANEVWAYNPPDSSYSAGSMFKNYVEGFIDALKWYVEKYGDEGKVHFNEAVTQSELSLNVNDQGDKAPTISADIKDGVYRILFHHTKLGYNQNDQRDGLLKAVESVPRAGFSIVAKSSIEKHYTDNIDDVTATIAEYLALPDVILDPNFEANYEALSAAKTDKDWHERFGKATFDYFNDGLKYQLERQGFKGDEMLQEGLAELLTTKTFQIRVVKKTKNNATIETILENGTVYIQMTAEKWWYNASDAGSGLVDLL